MDGSPLATTENDRCASPCPVIVPLSWIHGAEVLAVHWHSRLVMTEIWPPPPAGGNDAMSADAAREHLVADGSVMLCDALLQPPAITAETVAHINRPRAKQSSSVCDLIAFPRVAAAVQCGGHILRWFSAGNYAAVSGVVHGSDDFERAEDALDFQAKIVSGPRSNAQRDELAAGHNPLRGPGGTRKENRAAPATVRCITGDQFMGGQGWNQDGES
jgi:hypothetical protein